jgi:hypothetical protein
MNFFFRSLSLTFVATTFASAASAAVMSMLYIGNENHAGLAVEKSVSGELFLLLDMDANPQRVEYGVSPGSVWSGVSVIKNAQGEPMAVLSINSGEAQGLVGTKNVQILDNTRARTHQRTNLSQDLAELAKRQLLRDETGRVYNLAEIKGVTFVYQKDGAFDTELAVTELRLPELTSGSIHQMAGDVVRQVNSGGSSVKSPRPQSPSAEDLTILDDLRKSEITIDAVKLSLNERLVKMGYSSTQAQSLVEQLLDFKNNGRSSLDILKSFELSESAMGKLGQEPEVQRSIEAAHRRNSGNIDIESTVERAGRK